MNERIRELSEQAGIHFGRSATLDGNNIARFVTTSDMEKFAELIVGECAHVAVFKDSGTVATADVAGYMAAGRSTAARLIKEHFGVEK
jgi:hypothetical protein